MHDPDTTITIEILMIVTSSYYGSIKPSSRVQRDIIRHPFVGYDVHGKPIKVSKTCHRNTNKTTQRKQNKHAELPV